MCHTLVQLSNTIIDREMDQRQRSWWKPSRSLTLCALIQLLTRIHIYKSSNRRWSHWNSERKCSESCINKRWLVFMHLIWRFIQRHFKRKVNCWLTKLGAVRTRRDIYMHQMEIHWPIGYHGNHNCVTKIFYVRRSDFKCLMTPASPDHKS